MLTETESKHGTIYIYIYVYVYIYIQIIDLMEEDEKDYWMVESVLFDGKKN